MRVASRSLDYIELQVAAMARWLVTRRDVIDYVVVAPHDDAGVSAFGGSVVIQAEGKA